MKKIQRAKKPTSKGSGTTNKPPPRDRKTTASSKAGFARGATSTRIPVRGDAKKKPKGDALAARRGGVSTRGVSGRREGADSAPTTAAARHDLDQLRALALEAMDAALDKKALMPVLIDVSGLASYTDFIGIVSGRSDRQVDAIADNIVAFMKSRGRHILGQEGSGSGRWTLLDFGSVVIHVFYHPIREFYDLESLWIEAPRVKLEIPPEAMLTQPDALYGAL